MAINVEHVRFYLTNAPFKPFDIRTTDGRVYTVDQPEFLLLSRDPNILYYETTDGRLITMALSQIAVIEIANTQAA